jgi:uncharacterized protein GlcG (DUF336 family)
VPVAVCVIDIHGNTILHHRMNGAPVSAIELSERKAYTTVLVRMRTADILLLVQPGGSLFPLMSQGRYCAMGGGAPLRSGGELVAGVGISGGSVEENVAILEAAIQDRLRYRSQTATAIGMLKSTSIRRLLRQARHWSSLGVASMTAPWCG